MTKIFAIVGDPIDQARSPSLFNGLFRDRKVDAVMVPVHVGREALPKFLDGMRDIANLGGLVVTVPHKIAAAEVAQWKSARASISGAANVLRPRNGEWEADLFDGEGFAKGLDATGHQLRDKKCAVVGCGGAGAAIALALLDRHVARLSLWDRHLDKCTSLAARLKVIRDVDIVFRLPDESDDFAINATPLGMNAADPLPFPVDALARDAVVAEVVMKPPRTKLLEAASAHGLRTQEGHHMLDHQVESIWEFFGLPPATNAPIPD